MEEVVQTIKKQLHHASVQLCTCSPNAFYKLIGKCFSSCSKTIVGHVYKLRR